MPGQWDSPAVHQSRGPFPRNHLQWNPGQKPNPILTPHPEHTLQWDLDPKSQHQLLARRASREESHPPNIFASIADKDLQENPILTSTINLT
ncbi:hypothetical protein M413DRAFT_446544 [Hebeloma cylindrosporum]|uniref:Uncharacterized protein n=1 Tax=Hebeloma cylindrosporum TaxID=76867 RepID=A0A0C3C807_HEBCY|nr:hypothetical protein M413DRAFT_446544 [Hebeloma cylindrosporum h7]